MRTAELWRRAGHEIAQELALYRSLLRWLVRRPDVPPAATPLGYAQLSAPMMWLWIIGSATEVVVVEVVLRNLEARWAEVIRLPLLVLGIWGVAWMLGQLASWKVRPHLVWSDRLQIRNGTRSWVQVPREAVRAVRAVEHDYPGVMKSLHHEGDLLLVGMNLRSNLELELLAPAELETSHGRLLATRIGLWVDDPRATAPVLRAWCESPGGEWRSPRSAEDRAVR